LETGQVYEISDPPNRFYFAAVANGEDVVFYDLVRDQPADDVEVVSDAQPLLRLAVSHPTIKRARWRLLGKVAIRGSLAEYGEYFHGQSGTDESVRVYSNKDASVRAVPAADAVEFEFLGVWDAVNHITPILREHFFGEPSQWSKDIRSKRFRRSTGSSRM
jgi:hypothetical protein